MLDFFLLLLSSLFLNSSCLTSELRFEDVFCDISNGLQHKCTSSAVFVFTSNLLLGLILLIFCKGNMIRGFDTWFKAVDLFSILSLFSLLTSVYYLNLFSELALKESDSDDDASRISFCWSVLLLFDIFIYNFIFKNKCNDFTYNY